jgi:hypothetical protein
MSSIAVATEIFALPMIAMALFLVVWCLQGWARFYRNPRARRGANRGRFELESRSRGLTLMKDWLSPAQLQSYEKHRYFEVVGSDSAGTYRIHHGTQANVEQLDSTGRPVCAWCFVPEGDLVAGDVMLAQKIALETNERAALTVAIRYAALRNRSRYWDLD